MMSYSTATLVSIGLLVGTSPAAPQNTPEAPAAVPAAELLELRVKTFEVLLDSLAGGLPPTVRIWLVSDPERDPVTGEVTRTSHSPAEVQAIQSRFPSVRLPDDPDRLFLCPPGAEVRMPGSGCPILEDGVIVRLSSVRVSGARAEVTGVLMRSGRSEWGVYSWAEGATIEFERAASGWTFSRFTSRWIT